MGGAITVKKILTIGGSDNVIDGNNQDFHYLTLLQKFGGYDITNISVGGLSSDEVFYRVIAEVEQNEYDLVLILWVPLGRKWAYFSDDNIDDFTIMNNGDVTGFNKDLSAGRKYATLHYAYFNNEYINVHQYLSQLLMLQNYFKAKNTPLIMYRYTWDFIKDLLAVGYSEESGFTDLSDRLKEILDFNNRPDDYILKKINVLKLFIEKIDRSVWIDFENFEFFTQTIDRQLDGFHAGPITHDIFFKILLSKLKEKKLI